MPVESDLRREWRRLRTRDSACEGIPMIVAVETVGAAPPAGAGEPLVAARFGEIARALGGEADPAAVLEILAAREITELEP